MSFLTSLSSSLLLQVHVVCTSCILLMGEASLKLIDVKWATPPGLISCKGGRSCIDLLSHQFITSQSRHRQIEYRKERTSPGYKRNLNGVNKQKNGLQNWEFQMKAGTMIWETELGGFIQGWFLIDTNNFWRAINLDRRPSGEFSVSCSLRLTYFLPSLQSLRMPTKLWTLSNKGGYSCPLNNHNLSVWNCIQNGGIT